VAHSSITHTDIMSKFYTQLHSFRDRTNKFIARFKRHRLVIPLSVLNEFTTQEDQDAFIKNQLSMNGFDLSKQIHIYNGVTQEVRLFEQ